MPIFVILIIVSFSFYIFYKVKFFRSKQPAERQWISAKSRIALGSFVAIFGLNQLFYTIQQQLLLWELCLSLLGIEHLGRHKSIQVLHASRC